MKTSACNQGGHSPLTRQMPSSDSGSWQVEKLPSVPKYSGGCEMRCISAARFSLCSGLPAGAEANIPVVGLNEFMVVSDMQSTVWPQADRFPRDSSTALPASALREKWRRCGSCNWQDCADALPAVFSSPVLSVKLLTLSPTVILSKLSSLYAWTTYHL